MNILIYGAGYVGYPLGLMLSKHNEVSIAEVDQKKIRDINENKPVIEEDEIHSFLTKFPSKIKAVSSQNALTKEFDVYILATPTNYDENINFFDTSTIENILDDINSHHKNAYVIIKSTVPIGFTSSMRQKYTSIKLDVCPEFIREGKSFHDNNFPSRLIISDSDKSKFFTDLIKSCCEKDDVYTIVMSAEEAESVKLFSNTYLAMRVAYFNELDTFSVMNNLSSEKIISGISSDPRIGNHYNNPSFGYGGYCLPKDTKQLRANFENIPSNLIEAIVDSNATRKRFIADQIVEKKPKLLGVYRIIMKEGSNNYRSSAILDVINYVRESEIAIIIFEPLLKIDHFNGCEVTNNLEEFKKNSDLIISNRKDLNLDDVNEKVFSRDIFNID